ncbi:hypothetical protein OZY43_04340 [Lactobacillus sp. ESL0785]|uniref:hypothetical protein n=1 Tax=Lactobacillus sp. ESL0785 TaxID=2983232 RepID=UPI0023F79562|nr:hypothetical protein [Lactobacillus sp. ESL0785]WEV70191.1 hypothetical protein OZY43_04340 [Lactobacillus sp. ESL0785]
MTNGHSLFKALFKQKKRTVYLLWNIQLIAALAIAGFNYLNANRIEIDFDHLQMTAFFPQWLILIIGLSFISQLLNLFIIVAKSEEDNTSQTWRLIPNSDTHFYLINLVSSLISQLYLALLQLLAIAVLGGVSLGTSSTFRTDFSQFWQHNISSISWNAGAIMRILELVFLILLMLLAILVTLSMIILCWQLIIEFLSTYVNQTLLRFILFFCLFAAYGPFLNLLSNWFKAVDKALFDPLNFIAGQWTASITISMISLLVYILVLLGINLLLFTKFIEAKANN